MQNFSTCSKWQLTYSICCQHTKECHKPISHITIMSFKPIFDANLHRTHTMYFQRAPQTHFFYMKNKHHILPPPHLSTILTTMRMEFPFASNFSHTLHISAPIAATKLTITSLMLILSDADILNVHVSLNLVLTLGIGGRGGEIGCGFL